MTERHNWGPHQWADYIIAAHGRTVASIVETGKRWGEYRAAVHAEKQIGWGDKVFDLTGYGKRSANRHILIHEKLSPIGTRYAELPSSWRALSELARLDTDKIETLLDAGLVTRSSTRKDIVAAVTLARDILPQDFRIAFGGDYCDDLREAMADFQAVTEVAKGETTKGSSAPPDAAVPAAGADPRVRSVLNRLRGFNKWVDTAENPFDHPDARREMVGFIKHWAGELGLTVTEKPG
ncbi:hypothetical protein EOI86_23840 [Hwanghaeella grinnelliae]|uniref:Uncharacterized protein n=1 Tax=Hwanghaeella grinnelliae TaxID=2500179 RepID=A0A3S2W2I4_9PROT|nr:hypothetical protein [Hwanghaeella grinnelliae]RVU34145.1 hypothetical protein EOI86_23840 [Hwanghaeella grinnelliae]